MKVGISDRAWERVARSVHFTERQTGAGGRLPLGLGSGSPVWVRVGVLATPSAADCESCPDGAPETWRATLAGFGVCGGSPDPNGNLTLTYTTGCTWTGTLNGIAWTLAYVAGAWELTDDTIGARYTLTGSAWSCTGPNEMGRTGVTGCGESPESVTLAAASPATLKAGAYEAVFQLWNNDAAAFEDAPEPNACYAVDVDGDELEEGKVYPGGVVWQYVENGMVLVAVDDVWGGGNGFGNLTSSTLLPCPVIPDADCCILFPECGTVYDCNGVPIERSGLDFAGDCADGIEGVSTTVPSNCGDRVVHCGNTESACLPRCDYPGTDDVLTDADVPGDCCTPSVGSVMESSPHAGECGFFPPCVTIAGGNGTGTLAGITFDTAANVNYDAEWPFAYTAPGGNFYLTGRLVLCLESPFPGWYFAGRVYVYNPAGNSGSGDTDECGCDTVFGACPTAADDASQEIVAFHLGDKTETLRLTTACGTLDLSIAPCDAPDVPDPVEYACVAGPTGNICTPTVGGPYLNDPTCGGKCDEADPDPDPVPEPCCDGAGDPLEGHPDLMLYPFNLFVGSPSSLGPFVWDGTAYVYGDFTHPHTGTVYTNARIICDAGVWYARSSQPEKVAIAASCTPFGVVFEDAFGLGQTANAVIA